MQRKQRILPRQLVVASSPLDRVFVRAWLMHFKVHPVCNRRSAVVFEGAYLRDTKGLSEM
jgi:hypothetical protein